MRFTQPIGDASLTLENLTGSQAPNQFSLTASTLVLEPQQCVLAVYCGNVWTVAS